MDFNLIDLELRIESDNSTACCDLMLLLRREFAHVCRAGVCRWLLRDCGTCSSKITCSWYTVFGQELSQDPEALRRHQKPPLPYAFSFSNLEGLPAGPACSECRLVVIGRAIPHLGMLLKAVEQICCGRFEIVQAAFRDYQGTRQYFNVAGGCTSVEEHLVVLSAGGIMESRPWESSELEIRLCSPLKLIADGRQLTQFDFQLFARSLLRRISSLACYYGEGDLDVDYRCLSHQAAEINPVEMKFGYTHTPGGNRKLSGMSGSGRYGGDFGGLLPFLVLGTYLNVGKGASFGLGQYQLISAPCCLQGNRNV